MSQSRPTHFEARRPLAAMLFAFVLLGLLAGPAVAAKKKINQTLIGGVAIKGYDPVAYFDENKAGEGQKAIRG